jgi:hydrogenase nickel incorporation protein HypA/HybF
MHEASLIVDLLRRIEAVAAAEHARRVTGVTIWLGALSHLSPEHFAEHFAQESPGTIAEGARLSITASDDPGHANAQDVLIESVEVES